MDLIAEIGGYILNGTTRDNNDGEYTYVLVRGARGCSVIDYIIVNELCNNVENSFKVGERSDSDHWITGNKYKGRKQRRGHKKRKEETKLKILSDVEARRIYEERTEEEQIKEGKGDKTIEEESKDLKERVQGAMVKKKVMVKKQGIGHKI